MNQPSTPDPDERCGVCDETRENHGDMQHVFSLDGILIAKSPTPPARNTPPSARADALAKDPVANLVLRLVERLIANGVLVPEDLMYVMGGIDASNRGQTRTEVVGDNPDGVSSRSSGVDSQ